jgi:hypothetical protein
MKKYHFMINNDPHEWPNEFISGAEVRTVPPGIPDSMDLFIKRRGQAGVLVQNKDEFDLKDPGIEKFYTQDASSEAGAE